MANINLLPWREELRQERNQEFITVLAGVFIIAAGIAFLWMKSVDGDIAEQRAINSHISDQIKLVDDQIKEIDDLKKTKEELISRMDAIQKLQGDRPIIVHLFDDFVRRLPEGVYFDSITRSGNHFTIRGVAESNNKISNLMRKLGESKWLSDPILQKVENSTSEDEGNVFFLSVKEQAREAEEAGDGSEKSK